MDEQVLSELLECSVCLERLDENSKVLPCQHTFCRRCLDEILCTKQEIRCPECRALVEIPVEELPSNILLIRLLEGLKNVTAKSSGGSTHSPVKSGSGASSCSSPSHVVQVPASTAAVAKIAQPCAKALYSYEAKEPGDLSFRKGDVIQLKKQVDENWYHGELSQQHGFFPATYVEVITALSSPQEVPKCTALYDFVINDKDEKDCLTFQKDEMLTVIRRVDDNWVEGKRGDRIGIFPISFVELNESAKWLINNQAAEQAVAFQSGQVSCVSNGQSCNGEVPSQTRSVEDGVNIPASTTTSPTATGESSFSTTSMSPVTSESPPSLVSNPDMLIMQGSNQKRHSLTTISPSRCTSPPPNSQQRHSMEVPSSFVAGIMTSSVASVTSSSDTVTQTSTSTTTITTTSASALKTEAGPVSSRGFILPSCIYVALYNYKPQKDDEIELKKSDYYTVSEKCQDGWFKGTCLSTAKMGVFPGNYVQVIGSMPSKVMPSRPAQAKPGFSAYSAAGTPASTSARGINTGEDSSSNSISNGSPPAVSQCSSSKASSRTRASVSRAHSFPHTSPLALARAAHKSSTHARTVAQAQSRNILNTSQSPSRMVSSYCDATAETGTVSKTTSTSQTGAGSSPAHTPLLPDKPHVHTNQSVTSYSHSPRSGRKSERSKHFHGQHTQSTMSAHHLSDVASTCGGGAASGTVHHSISATVTQSSVGLAAKSNSTHIPSQTTSSSLKDHDKKEKKERFDKLGLVKRLTNASGKSKKSKSPPPEFTDSDHAISTSQQPTSHKCTGSLPGSTTDKTAGAASAVNVPPLPAHHKKSSSGDGAAKPAKVKPLSRERYRCIVPYPPQSDLELDLKPGDVVFVMKKREDGWYKGMLQRTGKTGLFPRSFVESF